MSEVSHRVPPAPSPPAARRGRSSQRTFYRWAAGVWPELATAWAAVGGAVLDGAPGDFRQLTGSHIPRLMQTTGWFDDVCYWQGARSCCESFLEKLVNV